MYDVFLPPKLQISHPSLCMLLIIQQCVAELRYEDIVEETETDVCSTCMQMTKQIIGMVNTNQTKTDIQLVIDEQCHELQMLYGCNCVEKGKKIYKFVKKHKDLKLNENHICQMYDMCLE